MEAWRTVVLVRGRGLALGLCLGLICGLAEQGAAEIYTWVDRDGQVHFTDNYASVPPAYRDRVQTRPSSPPSDHPPFPAPARAPKQEKLSSRPPFPSMGGAAKVAKVVAVLDGDTIVISGGQKVRYAGVNTPESHHPDMLPQYCGAEAAEANRRLVAGKIVRLEFDQRRRDKYGRLLAYVYVDSLFVNAELIRQGYAQVSTYRDNRRYHDEFSRLQESAITARRGLWGGCRDMRAPRGHSKSQVQPRGR